MKLTQLVWIVVMLVLILNCQKKQEAEQEVITKEKQETVSIIDVSAFSYVCFPYIGSYKDHEKVIDEFMQAATAQGFEMTAPMLGIYYNSPMDTPENSLVWEIGFVVPESLVVSQPLVVKKWTFTKVAKAIHTGPYETVDQTYPKIFELIGKKNMISAGPTMERFLSDPQQVPSEQLKTEIWVPVSSGKN
jgi:AraC family transcriptional regulator